MPHSMLSFSLIDLPLCMQLNMEEYMLEKLLNEKLEAWGAFLCNWKNMFLLQIDFPIQVLRVHSDIHSHTHKKNHQMNMILSPKPNSIPKNYVIPMFSSCYLKKKKKKKSLSVFSFTWMKTKSFQFTCWYLFRLIKWYPLQLTLVKHLRTTKLKNT